MSYDPHYANVSLLLHGDGADNGTVFTDNGPSPKTVTGYGNAKTSTAQSKFGGSSIALDGSGDYLSVPASSDFAFGTGDFTLECWIKTSYSGESIILDQFYSAAPVSSWQLAVKSGVLSWYRRLVGGSSSYLLTGSTTISDNAWHHVAVTRASNTLRFFVDGVANGSVTDSADYATSVVTFGIGAQVYSLNSAYDLAASLDEIRITKGVARYTSEFTPPSLPFPNYGQSVEVISSAGTPLGAASAYAQSVIVSHAKANTPLGSALAFAFSGQIAFASAETPLGTVSALSVVVSACRIAAAGPLGVPATLASYSISARVAVASPLGIPQPLAWHDFTGQIGDTVTRYLMDLITPTGTVRVPISSWQATLQTGASNYVQCVVPACTPWNDAINAATEFVVYRAAQLPDGSSIEYEMARAPSEQAQFDRGPSRETCTMSGYSPAFAASENPPTTFDRELSGIRSISSGSSYRVRSAVDWLLRPGHRALAGGAPFVVKYINYYVTNELDAYMDAGS